MPPALFAQPRFDRFPFGFGFRVAKFLQQAFDRGVRIAEFFGGADPEMQREELAAELCRQLGTVTAYT